ncbi:unnamed protein product, partial [Nesidiocoris tenuis]
MTIFTKITLIRATCILDLAVTAARKIRQSNLLRSAVQACPADLHLCNRVSDWPSLVPGE